MIYMDIVSPRHEYTFNMMKRAVSIVVVFTRLVLSIASITL